MEFVAFSIVTQFSEKWQCISEERKNCRLFSMSQHMLANEAPVREIWGRVYSILDREAIFQNCQCYRGVYLRNGRSYRLLV